MATNRFLIVGKYAVGSNRGLNDVDLVDTRVRGGGIKEELVTDFKGSYPQIRWFNDIGHYDGTPFPGATAVLVDLPASLLEVNGGIFNKKQIDSIIKHHLSFGIYPVIRFYCTNTGLVKHEDVSDSTVFLGTWDVPEGEFCPDEDGTVLCTLVTSTTTTTTTTVPFPLCGVFNDKFLTITGDWTETDAGGIAAPGVNGYRHDVHSNNFAELEGNFTVDGDFDITLEVNIGSWATGVTFTSNVFIDLGNTLSLGIRGAAHITPDTLQYYVGGGDKWSKLTSFGELTTGGQHFLRVARVGTQIRVYVWDDTLQQWDWDGDTGGNVHNDSWPDPVTTTLTWTDVNGTTDYIEGDMTEFCINAGTKV